MIWSRAILDGLALSAEENFTLFENKMPGMKLRRTMTIADGGDKCDFRYSRK